MLKSLFCLIVFLNSFICAASKNQFVNEDEMTTSAIRKSLSNAVVYNLNSALPADSSAKFTIPNKMHYFVYGNYVVEASGNALLKNSDLEGSRYSMRAICGTLRDWISSPGKHSIFMQCFSNDPKDIATSSFLAAQISHLSLYSADNFKAYLQCKLNAQERRGRSEVPRPLSRDNVVPSATKPVVVTQDDLDAEDLRKTAIACERQKINDLMSRYKLTRENLASIISRYAGQGLSISEIIERAMEDSVDISERSPSPGVRKSTTSVVTKKSSARSVAATIEVTEAVRQPSPFRTGIAGKPQKINWENERTNSEYERVLKEPGNNAAFEKFQLFKKTVKTAGTAAIQGVKPFHSQQNVWVYDLSDKLRLLFRKNEDGSITILKGAEHYRTQR